MCRYILTSVGDSASCQCDCADEYVNSVQGTTSCARSSSYNPSVRQDRSTLGLKKLNSNGNRTAWSRVNLTAVMEIYTEGSERDYRWDLAQVDTSSANDSSFNSFINYESWEVKKKISIESRASHQRINRS